jgi:iron complex transport system substrate-binding protein
MGRPARRICSLLPSATEIVCALGLEDRLVAVTHECDYPAIAREKPAVTTSVISSETLTAGEIDLAVRDSLTEQATIYHLDAALLDELRPDLILTQDLCEVCAVGSNEVRQVVAGLAVQPHVVSLEPSTLGDVLDSILLVGRLTGTLRRALQVVERLREHIRAVEDAVRGRPVRRVLTLEWTDPPFVGGHWVPEMVALAGGEDVLGRVGEPSREVTWEEIAATDADIAIAMPCGFGLQRSVEEVTGARLPDAWNALPVVVEGRVFAVDGSSYFNRPGPRLVDGVEILAAILHPRVWSSAPAGSWERIPSVLARDEAVAQRAESHANHEAP